MPCCCGLLQCCHLIGPCQVSDCTALEVHLMNHLTGLTVLRSQASLKLSHASLPCLLCLRAPLEYGPCLTALPILAAGAPQSGLRLHHCQHQRHGDSVHGVPLWPGHAAVSKRSARVLRLL